MADTRRRASRKASKTCRLEMKLPGLIARDQPGQRQSGKGGAESRTAGVEETRLHKRGFASAEAGEEPPRTPKGILDIAGDSPPVFASGGWWLLDRGAG